MAGAPRSYQGLAGRRAAARPELKPLPWPPEELAPRQAREAHAHRCTACAAEFRCPGPDETGFCAPVCPPCYWVELGRQVRIYRSVVEALIRRRSRIERRVGSLACRQAQRRRASRNLRLLAASGAPASVSNGNESSDGGLREMIERAVAGVEDS